MSCESVTGCVQEDSTFTVMARCLVNGAIWSQAAVATITYSVWNTDSPGSPIVNGSSLTVASVVFDALQTDARWTEDSLGYNFRHTLASTVCTEPGEYRIEYKVTLASGGVFFLSPVIVTVEDVWTS